MNAQIISRSASATRWSFLTVAAAWIDVARQRKHLAKLDDAMLRDIGVTRGAADTEARRPFWDAPAIWRR